MVRIQSTKHLPYRMEMSADTLYKIRRQQGNRTNLIHHANTSFLDLRFQILHGRAYIGRGDNMDLHSAGGGYHASMVGVRNQTDSHCVDSEYNCLLLVISFTGVKRTIDLPNGCIQCLLVLHV